MNNQTEPRHPFRAIARIILLFVWGVICLQMTLAGMIGLACVILGMVSLFADLSRIVDIQLAGESVRSTTQKLLLLASGLVLLITGAGFWWFLRRPPRPSLAGALICWAIVLVLFLATAWATGRGDFLSISSPAR
jgi:hypothetical protein